MPVVKIRGGYRDIFLRASNGRIPYFSNIVAQSITTARAERPIFDTVALFLHGFFTNSDIIETFQSSMIL
jgi:hypothetical protein